MKDTGKSLHEFLYDKQNWLNNRGELYSILTNLMAAARFINHEVRRAGLSGILGEAGSVNVQGEKVQKLDILSNDLIISRMAECPHCAGVGSEENAEVVPGQPDGSYVVAIDPLDGSSNIDITAPVGTIFSVYRRKTKSGKPAEEEDFLRKGSEQAAAGYVIYGSSTVLVLTTGNGVNGFTLDPHTGDFILSHPQMKLPQTGKIYSLNEGYDTYFPEGIRKFLMYCKEEDKASNRPYSGRYIGSLVGDFHRTLLKGGIFLYPATSKAPEGKLRLVYEGHPMAFIAEQAGGTASNGSREILTVKAEKLHQRTPLLTGSKDLVETALQYL